MPDVTAAVARASRRVRVTFSGALSDLTTGTNGALNPANWTFSSQATVGGIVAVAAVAPASAEQVTTSVIDVLLAQDLTPSAPYRVTAKAAAQGGITGVSSSPLNRADFAGFLPVAPAERDFAIRSLVPRGNLDADYSQDLERFVSVLQDINLLSLQAIDRWTDILDLNLASDGFLDAMLSDLNYPFEIALSTTEKRRLLSVLVQVYKQKGTVAGIKNAVRLFLGYECDVVTRVRMLGSGWVLGYSELDIGSILSEGAYYDATLHGSDLAALTTNFDFLVKVGTPSAVALTSDEDKRVRAIVELLKPAHTHLLGVSAVLPPPTTVSAAGGSGANTVTWSAVTAAAGYAVFWSATPAVGAASPTGAVDPDNASPYVHSPLSAGQQRYYVVCARTAGGINGVASARVQATAT